MSASLTNNQEIVKLLKAVGNEQRLLIVQSLMQGEKNVGELESSLTLSQSALSQHLARLRRDKIVQTRRKAQLVYYSLSNDNAVSLLKYLDGLES